jgi:hypothetical protein
MAGVVEGGNSKFEARNPKQIRNAKRRNDGNEEGHSDLRMIAPKMFINSVASPMRRSRSDSTFAFGPTSNRSKEQATFLHFLAADLHAMDEVLLAQRLVRFDVVGGYRAGRATKLSNVVDVGNGSRQGLDERPHASGELIGAVLEVVSF